MTLFIWKRKWKCASKFWQMPLIWNSALIFLVLISQLMCSSFFAEALEAGDLNSNSSTNKTKNGTVLNFNFSSKPVLQVQAKTSRNGVGQFQDYDEDEPLVFAESLDEISIKCNASYPIEWKWSSQTPQNWADYIIKSKEFSHQLEIHIKPKDQELGFFGYLGSCQYILGQHKNDNACGNGEERKSWSLGTRLDIFAPGKNSKAKYFIGAGGRYKITNRKKVKISGSSPEFGFLIPCPLMTEQVTERLNITLYQIFSEKDKKKVEEGNYDPKAGFYISKLQKLNGTFQCRADSESELPGEAGESVTFEFVQNQNQGEEWLNNKDPIKSRPKVGKKDTQVFYIDRFEQKIICKGTSIANVHDDVVPKFEWTKISDNGTEEKVGTHLGFKLSYSPDKTTLKFPRISQELQGTYVCRATWSWTSNSDGTTTSIFRSGSKRMYILVKKWKIGIAGYVVIALGSLATLVGLIVCAVKCWNARAKPQ